MTDQPATMRRPRPRPAAAEASEDPSVTTPAEPDADDEAGGPSLTDSLSGGWSDAQRQQDATSTYAQALKPDKDLQFIEFLEDKPYVNYRRHWVERTGENGVYKRPYVCLQSVQKRCPLCDVGDRPQAVSSFNVALIGDDGGLDLKSWDVTGKVFAAVKNYSSDPRVGPLTKMYFGVNKTAGSKKGTTQTNANPMGATSLRDDYGIAVPTEEQLAAVPRYDKTILDIPKTTDLQEIADEMADAD